MLSDAIKGFRREVFLYVSEKLPLFQNSLLQRELFLIMCYTINISPSLLGIFYANNYLIIPIRSSTFERGRSLPLSMSLDRCKSHDYVNHSVTRISSESGVWNTVIFFTENGCVRCNLPYSLQCVLGILNII